ncbi:MAG TPA: DegV family protein [Anaerolineaceae bacterium]|nr:DegV family protein [Anaerolineaceae bacterium]
MILTDSSAYLPTNLVARYPIRVLPLTLSWDGQAYRDGVDIKPEEFYRRLATSNTLPQTSQLSVSEINSNVRELISKGYDVLLMPISSGISGTYQTAVGALQNFPKDRVTVLDTKLVCMGLGLQILAAARAADSGASLSKCKRIAQQVYPNIGVYGSVDDLKYLAAGGRINSAKRLLGAAINLKPVLQFRDGKVELVCSVISRRKAVVRMLDLVEEEIGNRTPIRISVFHTQAEGPANEFLELARKRFSPIESILAEFSPVIGVHVGPGTLAITFQAGTGEGITPHDGSGRSKLHAENLVQRERAIEPAEV